jgi:hypothetical protein
MNPEANGHTIEEKSAFWKTVGVSIAIKASSEKIWSLLTDAPNIPKWNSTVTEISGTIAYGNTVSIKVPILKRTFKVKVDEFQPAKRLVWSDGNAIFRGVRTYTLSPGSSGSTIFSMVEVFTGLMLPMIAPSLPDFKPVFSQYAADLKNAAEKP